jgi:hypothetical protein
MDDVIVLDLDDFVPMAENSCPIELLLLIDKEMIL